jgi:hypothetical protein
LQCLHEWLDLAQLAAAARVAPVQNSKFGFLLRDSLSRFHIHEVQVPRPSHAVTKQASRFEVISRVKEEDRNVGKVLTKQMQHNHVFGLEAIRDACPTMVLLQRFVNQISRINALWNCVHLMVEVHA